jgi:hypothetical protein
MNEVSPNVRRNRRRFRQIECAVALASVLAAVGGYLLHVSTLEFAGVVGGVAGLAFLVARSLLVTE